MLGEIHSLVNDFPEHVELIHKLNDTDNRFHSASKQYNALDRKIRTLELNNVPTTDSHFLELKKQRLELKDALYQTLTSHLYK